MENKRRKEGRQKRTLEKSYDSLNLPKFVETAEREQNSENDSLFNRLNPLNHLNVNFVGNG